MGKSDCNCADLHNHLPMTILHSTIYLDCDALKNIAVNIDASDVCNNFDRMMTENGTIIMLDRIIDGEKSVESKIHNNCSLNNAFKRFKVLSRR